MAQPHIDRYDQMREFVDSVEGFVNSVLDPAGWEDADGGKNLDDHIGWATEHFENKQRLRHGAPQHWAVCSRGLEQGPKKAIKARQRVRREVPCGLHPRGGSAPSSSGHSRVSLDRLFGFRGSGGPGGGRASLLPTGRWQRLGSRVLGAFQRVLRRASTRRAVLVQEAHARQLRK